MKDNSTQNNRVYRGQSSAVCIYDYWSTNGLLSIWKWHIPPQSGLENYPLALRRDNCLLYTHDAGIDIEAEYPTAGRREWLPIDDGIGLCVPAGHTIRIRSSASEPVQVEVLLVPASAEDRHQLIELEI